MSVKELGGHDGTGPDRSSRPLEQNPEPCLFEMMVGREHVLNLEALRDEDTYAVHQTPFLIRHPPIKIESRRDPLAIRFDDRPAGRLFDAFDDPRRRTPQFAATEGITQFHDHQTGRDKRIPAADQSPPYCPDWPMKIIPAVSQGDQGSGVHEDGFHARFGVP